MNALLAIFLSCLVSNAENPENGRRLEEAKHYLQTQFDQSPYPGLSVAVVQGGKLIWAQGYGVEELGADRPMTAQSSSAIGSLTKSFTVMALMRLVEEGKLDLDLPVVHYLPWFQSAIKERSDKITVRHLLSNASGLPSLDFEILGTDTETGADERLTRTLNAYVLNREPGSSFEYCNEGFAVAGLIGAQLSGLSYPAMLKHYVLSPLRMARSSSDLAEVTRLGGLNGHFPGFRQGIPAEYGLKSMAYAAAGSVLRCSAEDLGHYLIALLQGGTFEGERVVSRESLEEMWRPHIGIPVAPGKEPMAYGLGWVVSNIDGRKVIHHGGDALTMTSYAMLEPERGSGVAILSNIASLDRYRFTAPVTLANNILHILHGEPLSDYGKPEDPDPTRNDYELPTEMASGYAGTYAAGGLSNAQVAIQQTETGSFLVSQRQGVGLVRQGELDFLSPARAVIRALDGPQMAEFKITLNGEVYGLTCGGGSFHKVRDHEAATAWNHFPDGSLAFQVPKGWLVRWEGNSFHASPVPSSSLSLAGKLSESLSGSEGSGAENAAAPGRVLFSGEEGRETIGKLSWKKSAQVIELDGRRLQRLTLTTHLSDRALTLVFTVPDGTLTERMQEVAIPFLKSLAFRESGS